jgi:chromosome segregation ATPase
MELQQKVSNVEKDVAVMQNEVRNFKTIMTRLDDAISSMTKVSNNLERLLVVHEERIKNNADNLDAHRREVGVMSLDIGARIDTLSVGMNKRFEALEEHKQKIEKWRWHLGGVWAALVVFAGIIGKLTGIW